MNESDAKEYVIKTILTGDAKRISEVIEHYRLAFGKKETIQQGVVTDTYTEATKIFAPDDAH